MNFIVSATGTSLPAGRFTKAYRTKALLEFQHTHISHNEIQFGITGCIMLKRNASFIIIILLALLLILLVLWVFEKRMNQIEKELKPTTTVFATQTLK